MHDSHFHSHVCRVTRISRCRRATLGFRRYDLQYAYVVDGKTYYALVHDSNAKAADANPL